MKIMTYLSHIKKSLKTMARKGVLFGNNLHAHFM